MASTTQPATAATDTPGEERHAASPHAYDLGLLVLRIGFGLTIAAHGSQKLFGLFGGGGLAGTGKMFSAMGYPAGHAMAVVAGTIETFGGLALVLGLLTPLAAGALAGNMVNAFAVHGWGGFFAPKGGEYELILLIAAVTLTLTGPGRIAVDRFLPVLRRHRLVYGAGMLVLTAIVAAIVLLLKK